MDIWFDRSLFLKKIKLKKIIMHRSNTNNLSYKFSSLLKYTYIYIYVHIKDKFNKIIYIKNNRFYFNSKKNEEEENKIYLRVNEKILFHDLIGLLKFCKSWKQFHQLITISKSDNCHICIICITIILRMISITFRGTNNRSNTAN